MEPLGGLNYDPQSVPQNRAPMEGTPIGLPTPEQNVRTVYDDLPPFLLHVKDSQAAPEQNPDRRVGYFTGQNAFKTSEQIAMEQLQPKTVQPAPLDLTQFQDVQNQIQSILDQGKTRKLPKSTQPGAPGIEQLAIAAVLAFMNPEKAYDILAMPFAYGSQQASEQDQRNAQEFALQGQQDTARLKSLQDMLGPLMDAAVQKQKSQFDADKFNASEANDLTALQAQQQGMNDRAALKTPVGTYEQYRRLGLTPEDALNAVMADPNLKEARRLQVEADTKTENATRDTIVENLKKQGKVLDERALNLAEQTKYLGPKIGLQVAMFWLNMEQMKAQLAGIQNNAAVQMFKFQADNASNRVKGLQADIETNVREIQRLKAVQTDKDKLRVYMETHGISDPKSALEALDKEVQTLEARNGLLKEQAAREAVVPVPDFNVPKAGQAPFDIKGAVKGFMDGVTGKAAPKSKRKIEGNVPDGNAPVDPMQIDPGLLKKVKGYTAPEDFA